MFGSCDPLRDTVELCLPDDIAADILRWRVKVDARTFLVCRLHLILDAAAASD